MVSRFLSRVDQEDCERGNYNGCASMTIVLDPHERVLLNLRDDKPNILYPNHWAILGGQVEDGESPEETARRELSEEVGLLVEKLVHCYLVIDRDGDRHLVYVFVTRTTAVISDLALTEGQALGFFAYEEIGGLQLTPFVRQVLVDYFEKDG